MKKIAVAALLSAFIAAPVAAQDMYIGVNVGSAQIDVTGLNSSTAFSVLGGYTIYSNFAAEVAFVNFGSVDRALGTTLKSRALSVSAVGSIPLNDQFSLIGKLGVASTTFKATNFDSDSEIGVTFGVATQFNFDKEISMRAGYDVYKVSADSADENVMSLGAIYQF